MKDPQKRVTPKPTVEIVRPVLPNESLNCPQIEVWHRRTMKHDAGQSCAINCRDHCAAPCARFRTASRVTTALAVVPATAEETSSV